MPSKLTASRKRGINPARLNDRQAMFVQEYITDFDAVRACKAVGYHDRAQGYKLLMNPLVGASVAKAIYDREQRTQLTQDDVLRHLQTALLLDPMLWCEKVGDKWIIKDLDAIPEEARRCLKSLKYMEKSYRGGDNDGEVVEATWELTFMDKDSCQALAMKHHGLLIERKQIDLNVKEDVMVTLLDTIEGKQQAIPATFEEAR